MNQPKSQTDRSDSEVRLDLLVMRQAKIKEFAEQVIDLYVKYREVLSEKDLQEHNNIFAKFQNLRDKYTLSA